MSLPQSAEYPQVPLSQFDVNSPPFIPQIRTQPSIQQLVPLIAATVANEASIKAHSHAGRMFFYNLMVSNYWNNPAFAEVVQLVADIISINLQKRIIRSPEQGIQDAVVQAIGGYVSSLFFQYPDLKSMVAPQVLDAAHQNIQFFNNLKQEIASMHNNYPHNQMPVNTNYPGQPQMHPHMHQQAFHQPHPGMHHPGYPQVPMGHPGMPPVAHYPQYQHNPGYAPAPSYGGNYQASNGSTFASRPGGSSFQQPQNTDSVGHDRFSSRPVNTPPPPPAPVLVQSEQVKVQEQTTLLIDKGTEMERSKHQITFFGDSYVSDSAGRGKQFAKSTEEMVRTQIAEDDNTSIHVDQNITLEPCIDRAVTNGVIKQFEHQKEDSSINVFRCFSIVAPPMLCTVDVADYLETLRESNSFAMLAVKLKSLAMSLSIRKDNKQYGDSVMSFLARFDNMLTGIVNDFLRNNLQTGTKITSFTEDVNGLGDFLFNKYGVNYGSAFSQFESETINTMLEGIDPELCKDLVEPFDLPEGLFYALTPVNHSLTYIFMNDKELGYKLGNKPVVIDPETAPSLYQIASSLVNHKKQLGINTLRDMLITADNVRYIIYRNYLKQGEYLIDKA